MASILDQLGAFERDAGIPSGFVSALRNDDDWSFVIKSTALLEATITHLIIAHTAERALRPLLERLPLADKDLRVLRHIKTLAEGAPWPDKSSSPSTTGFLASPPERSLLGRAPR
jgi:hypothetical protein